MADLTKDSSIQELVNEMQGFALTPMRHALAGAPEAANRRKTEGNQKRLAAGNVQSLGDLLSPEGERVLYRLEGTGRKSMMAVQSFLTDRGLKTDWPRTDDAREHDRKKATYVRGGRGHALNLTAAIEEADKLYAAKTGEPVGDFSRKIAENMEAQKDGARLKGRRTL